MSYLALYRKFRPQTFEEVKGQDAIVATMKNQIKADRIGHAYLFCGTRGTGKTSVAKILAKAVNCEHPVDGSPCGECPTCKAIARGSILNVVEIDAASNNGVDNIRDLREQVEYAPTEGRYKVFIIDEVHMLSTGAFNALLKTLEEPPAYVIFILATTEVQKIPITILSRCQKYDFKRITSDVIQKRLKELTDKEGIESEDRALAYIAKAADGSMRDALSLLDQCIAFYLGQPLSYENVLNVLGAVETEVFHALLNAVMAKDTGEALRILGEIVQNGRDLNQFVVEFTGYMRNLMILQTGADLSEILDVSEEGLERLKEDAKQIEATELIRLIRIFSELGSQIKYSSTKRVLVEVALIKLCHPQMEVSYDSLIARISQLEKEVEELKKKGLSLSAEAMERLSAGKEAAAQRPLQEQKIPAKPKLPKAIPEDIRQVVANWKSIVRNMKEPAKTYLSGARLSIGGDDILLVVFEDDMAYGYIKNRPEHLEELEGYIEDAIEKRVEIRLEEAEANKFDDSYIDLSQIIHADIIVEDDEEE